MVQSKFGMLLESSAPIIYRFKLYPTEKKFWTRYSQIRYLRFFIQFLQDMNKRFFATCRHMNDLVPRRDRFFDFDLGHVTEAGNVENCRFLENWLMEFAENQQKKSVFNIVRPPFIKKFKIGSENLPIFRLHIMQISKIFKKNRFFKFWFLRF